MAYASGAPLPDGKVISPGTGEYARSTQLCQIGEFSAEVYSNLARAAAIEEDVKRLLGRI
jgi:hypothetical protein